MNNQITVAITNPYIWPYVRRGAERMLNDLSFYLREQGYGVEVYTMGPESLSWSESGIAYQTIKQRITLPFRQLGNCHYFAFALQPYLRYTKASIVHCLNYFDAYAAIKARARYHLNYKVIFHAVGIPTSDYFRAVPLDAYFFSIVLKFSDEILTLSLFAKKKLLTDFSCISYVLPPLVKISPYLQMVQDQNTKAPVILFVGDVTEERKGVYTLCKAFEKVKLEFPTATLCLSGKVTKEKINELVSHIDNSVLFKDIHFLGLGKIEHLETLYRQATITVLPAVWEAFGLVLVESLAVGTPVVGAKHAGIEDIINTPDVGTVFKTGPFKRFTANWCGLADAIIETITTVQTRDMSLDCYNRATMFSWKILGPEYERRYHALL